MTPRKISRYGWIPQLPDSRDLRHIPKAPTAPLPPSVDLRDFMVAMPPYDQGDLGSCTANMGAALFQYCAISEALSDQAIPSRLFLYYNERVIQGTVDWDSGAQCRDALKCLASIGSVPETEWPYDTSTFTTRPSDKCYADAAVEKAIQYAAVNQDRQSLKQCLVDGLPWGFGFTVYSSFEDPLVAHTGIVPMPSGVEKVLGGHAVVGCGYVDNSALPMTLPNGAILNPHDSGGYYMVRNSWGAAWGSDGYFLMPYAYIEGQLASDFWVLKLVD